MKFSKLACCFGLLFAASTSFAQMYTITDLGPLSPTAINNLGQVVGNSSDHAFLWSTSDGMEDLGVLPGGTYSRANDINDIGTIVGASDAPSMPFCETYWGCVNVLHGAVWTRSTGIVDLGENGCGRGDFHTNELVANAINNLGQFVGYTQCHDSSFGVFWTQSNEFSIVLPDWGSRALGINNRGQVVGWKAGLRDYDNGYPVIEQDGVTSWLARLEGEWEGAGYGINDLGQVAGWATASGCPQIGCPHAVLWTPTGEIQDLNTLPGDIKSKAYKINLFGQVIGQSFSSDDPRMSRPFIWSEPNGMQDLNALILADSGWVLKSATGINTSGQIVGQALLDGQPHGFLLSPVYKAFLQQPINADGSSLFQAKRGVVPVKFTLTQYDLPTCSLLPATVAVTRTAGGTLGAIDESTYVANADSGSDFRINGCQYIYNLAASSLGVGTYRVDISINGIMVGHAVFALK
jgi:probable HAF family extracellular repeat protein